MLIWVLRPLIISLTQSSIGKPVARPLILVVTGKPAREVNYELSTDGLVVDGRKYTLGEFRAFGVRRDGALWQLVIIPVKRFGLPVTTFINEEQGEQIVDFLGAILPMEEVHPDFVDSISKRLKL